MGLCKRSIRKLSLPGWLRVSRLGQKLWPDVCLAPPLEMEVQIAADGIILMRRVHRRHTLTMLPYPGDTGPTGHSPPRSITHNTPWAWAGRRGLNVHTCSLWWGLWNTIAKVRHFWGWCFLDETFPWDIWISCMWMHTVTHKSFLLFKVRSTGSQCFCLACPLVVLLYIDNTRSHITWHSVYYQMSSKMIAIHNNWW